MPNWCTNDLEIRGNEKDIAAIAALCRFNEGTFDFNAVVPMPQELKITCGSTTDNGLAVLYGEWQRALRYRVRPESALASSTTPPETRQELIALIEAHPEMFWNISLNEARQAKANEERYGAKTWYEWCIANWGTKWSAGDGLDVHVAGTSIGLVFDTAWSPPVPVIVALCKRFPKIKVAMHYVDEGGCFEGELIGSNGAVSTDDY